MSNDDILIGMKNICAYLKVSEKVVRRWINDCPEIPIIKDGQLMASTIDLADWQRQHILRKKSEAPVELEGLGTG